MNLGGIGRAEVPSQRWALPEDTNWDKYYSDYELWVNENYDMEDQMIAGMHMTFEDALENDKMFGEFLEWWTDRSE